MPEAAQLAQAWDWREKRGLFKDTDTLRIFHGRGEGTGILRDVAIDRFGPHFWVTFWESERPYEAPALERVFDEISVFLRSRQALSAVALWRPERAVPEEPRILFGEPPPEGFEVKENGLKFWIRLLGVKHPGLFLDHAPLRAWLRTNTSGLKVLNTFAYTGSLSAAAGAGDAANVTTLDLSKATTQWAQENWKLNGFADNRARFIHGDYFEWMPRLKREGARFDCVIVDPPSFSRGKKGNFSTSKDLKKLHEVALDLLSPEGYLITSINSANVSWSKYESEVNEACDEKGRVLEVVSRIELPETFPTQPGQLAERYLKGWILRSTER